MIDNNTLSLFRERYKRYSADGRGDTTGNTRVLTLGMVVNTDDPLEGGRLQIFCPALNDNPKKIFHLPWAAYVTPFGGSINNTAYTRGVGDSTAVSDGAIHYGFWGVPELGAHVLVGCIDGDPRRRFWVGCVPEHQETHTQFNGRFDWEGKAGTPDGPLTSSKKPIQPIYDNWTAAFVDRSSREWKTRGADYQPTAVTKASNGAPSKVRGDEYLDDTYEGMSKHEKDEWVRQVMGAHGYDWSGFKGAGAFKSSRVFGMSSPGFHSISMDDRPFNSRTKIRSATGHMILMDDTNERIYIMTNKGNNWIELDSNGNIDLFSENRVSIHSMSDLNLTAGGDIRMLAAQGIHMYAGHSADGQGPKLEDTPNPGEIRIQSEHDTHMVSLNLRQKTYENMYAEVGINKYDVVKGSSYMDVTDNINVATITGDYIQSISRDLFETITGDSKRFSFGTSAVSSVGDNENHSLAGGVTIGSKTDTTIKSAGGNVGVQATNGSVSTKGSGSETNVGPDGITGSTDSDISLKGKQIQMSVPSGSGSQPADLSSIPENNCASSSLSTSFPAWANDSTPRTLSDGQMVELAYAAGFRGQDLTMAVAVMKAESSGITNNSNTSPPDQGLMRGVPMSGSYGLFQIRAPVTPFPPGDYDDFRNNDVGQLNNPKKNAEAAFEFFKKHTPKGKWSTDKWSSVGGPAQTHLTAAQAAVDSKCGGPVMGMSMPASIPMGIGGLGGNPLDTSVILTAAGATIQSAADIDFRTISSHFNSYNDLADKLNTNIIKTAMYGYGTGLIVDKLTSIVSGFSIPMSFDLGCLASDLFSNIIPPNLMNLIGDLQNMQAMLQSLGFPDLELTLENLKDTLTAEMMDALGLPDFDLSSILNPMSAGCAGGILSQLGELTKDVEIPDIPPVEIPDFREVVHKIFGGS